MALIADSGALYALYDSNDAHHLAVQGVVEMQPGPIVMPVAILAELDYLLRVHLGMDADLIFSKVSYRALLYSKHSAWMT